MSDLRYSQIETTSGECVRGTVYVPILCLHVCGILSTAGVRVVENKMAGCHPPRSKHAHSVRPSPWSPPSHAPWHRQQQQPTNVRDPPARSAVACKIVLCGVNTHIRKTPYTSADYNTVTLQGDSSVVWKPENILENIVSNIIGAVMFGKIIWTYY